MTRTLDRESVAAPDNQALAELFAALAALLASDEYDNEFLQPTAFSVNRLTGWLLQASSLLPRWPSGGSLSTDGTGNLRVEWRQRGKEVCVVSPARPGEPAYLYHEENENYGAERTVSPVVIAHWLNWLLA